MVHSKNSMKASTPCLYPLMFLSCCYLTAGSSACQETTVTPTMKMKTQTTTKSNDTLLAIITITEPTPFLEESLKDTFVIFKTIPQVHAEIHVQVQKHLPLVERLKRLLESFVGSLTVQVFSPWSTSVERMSHRCRDLRCDFVFLIDPRVHLRNQNSLTHLMAYNLPVVAPVVKQLISQSTAYFSNRAHNWMMGVFPADFVHMCFLISGPVIGETDDYSADRLADRIRELAVDGRVFASNELTYGNLIAVDAFREEKLHPELWEIFNNPREWEERYLHPHYWKTVDAGLIENPCPDVFWMPLLSKRFCADLIAEVENAKKWSPGMDSQEIKGRTRAETRALRLYGTFDTDLILFDFQIPFTFFIHNYFHPVYMKKLPVSLTPPYEDYSFVVRYRLGEQVSLRRHVDQGMLSLNIALNQHGVDYHGGGTRFVYSNCRIVATRQGWALFHPNMKPNHLHEGLTLFNGTRYVLVSFLY